MDWFLNDNGLRLERVNIALVFNFILYKVTPSLVFVVAKI